MTRGIPGKDHDWLVTMKAMRALTNAAAGIIAETGLGLADFAVLEVVLHKGPLPVNTIGIVDLDSGLDQYRCRWRQIRHGLWKRWSFFLQIWRLRQQIQASEPLSRWRNAL